MAQSSRGYNTDPEEDDRADALPLDTQDRASANLKSPDFEKAAVEPEPAEPRFATPMARALDGFVPNGNLPSPEASPLQGGGTLPATSPQSADELVQASPDATAPESAVQAPRLKGADDPEVGQALQHYGEQPEAIPPPRAGFEDAWLKVTEQRQRDNDQQQAGIHSFLKSRGVETETLPDGSQTIATHPDGAPVWKPATSAAFQDPDSGQWVVRQRDDHGNLRDVSAMDVHGAVHTDAKTGDQYVYDANRQPVKIGTDQGIATAHAIAQQRSFLYARENQAAAQIADLNASLAPVREQFHAMQAMPATESDALGGKSQSIKQVENTITSLQSSIDKGTQDPAVLEKYKAVTEARDKFYQDNPTYSQVQATLAAGKEQVRSIDADRRRDRDTRIQMALGTTSAAVQSTLPDTRAITGQQSGPPGDADPAEVARTAAVATGNGTPAAKALVGALRQMKASGAQTVNGRPIDEAISAAINPPVKPEPPEPEPQAPPDTGAGLFKNFIGSLMNHAQQAEDAIVTGGKKLIGMDTGGDKQERQWRQELESGNYSEGNPYAPGGPKAGVSMGINPLMPYIPRFKLGSDYVNPKRQQDVATGLAHIVPDIAGLVAAPEAMIPAMIAGGTAEGATQAEDAGTSQLKGAALGGAKTGLTLALFGGAGKIAGKLLPAIEAPLARGLAAAGISAPVNAAVDVAVNKLFGGNAIPQTPAEWTERLGMALFFAGHAGVHEAHVPEMVRTAQEKIQLANAQLAMMDAAQPLAEQQGYDATVAEIAKARDDAQKFLKSQNPALVKAIDAKVKAAADIAKSAVDSAPPDPVEAAAGTARAFTDTLRKSDILQRKAEALPADHPLEERASLTERQQSGQDALNEAHDAATEAVPEVARKAIAATLGAKPEAVQAHFDEQPDAAFQAAHVGRQLRELYTTPEQRTRLDSIAARVGEHGPTAQFIADQHVGMKAAKDLTAIAALREVPPERVAGLQRLGLVEMENGQPVVTHDALPLLPKGMTARLIGSHDAYRVKSLAGEKLQGAAAMVRAGQGQLEQALHAKALATRPPAEMSTHRVRVQFTNKAGKSGETTFDVKAPSEEHALTQATAQVEAKGTVKVDKAEITTREKEQARKVAKAAPPTPDPLAPPNVATPAKLSDFTPAEQQFANLVGNEYRRNQKYLEALGISKVELVRNSADKSGLAISSEGALQLDASQLKRQADTFSKQGTKAKEWARAALQEEAWHAIQFRAAGADFQTHYADLHSALSSEMLAHAREVYTDFDALPKHAQAAEVERMILQNKWNGTITERFVASIERILAYLRGLKIESPLLRESIARVEAVRDEALRQAESESPSRLAESDTRTSPENPPQPERSQPERQEPRPTSDEQTQQQRESSPEPATPAPEAQGTTRESLENDPRFDDVSGFFKAAKQGVRADYDGYKGTLQRDEQGRAVIVTDEGAHVEIPPEDQRLGTGAVILRDPVVEVTKDGKVSLNGKPYEFVRSNIGSDGTLESVTVKNSAGREQIVDNPRQAMTIALGVSNEKAGNRPRQDAEEAARSKERDQMTLFASRAKKLADQKEWRDLTPDGRAAALLREWDAATAARAPRSAPEAEAGDVSREPRGNTYHPALDRYPVRTPDSSALGGTGARVRRPVEDVADGTPIIYDGKLKTVAKVHDRLPAEVTHRVEFDDGTSVNVRRGQPLETVSEAEVPVLKEKMAAREEYFAHAKKLDEINAKMSDLAKSMHSNWASAAEKESAKKEYHALMDQRDRLREDAPADRGGPVEVGEEPVASARLEPSDESMGASRARKDTGTGDLFADRKEEAISSKRLDILKGSLAKKEAEFDARISAHFDDVKGANGQPLNDKTNGRATVGRWERQNDALRNLKESIEVTKAAIQREADTIAHVENVGVPPALRDMVEAGELVQWRKHPNTFFVKGVDKGRIYWDPEQSLVGYKYISDVPKDQYPAFRDAFNKAKRLVREHAERNAASSPDSLSAARAKTAAQKEAERLAKLRETRAGFAAEQGGKAGDGSDTVSVIARAREMVGRDELSRRAQAALNDPRIHDPNNLGDSVRKADAMERAARATVSGYWIEPPAPEPHILTPTEGRSAMLAYHTLKQRTGFPAVSIADLADQSGVPLDRLKQQLLRSQKAGSVVLSTGDWSLSSDKDKSGVIEDKGQKMLQVRFLNDAGGMAAAKAQTKTPQFKKWFGDSKVVEPDGSPRVVYHGSTEEFDTFKHGDLGFHFGFPEAAVERQNTGNKSGDYKIKSFFLSLENPIKATHDAGEWQRLGDAVNAIPDSVISKAGKEAIKAGDSRSINSVDDLRAYLQRRGFDGVVYPNAFEGGTSYIAFAPEQIKSATGNRGTFDPEDANTLHASKAVAVAHAKVAQAIAPLRDEVKTAKTKHEISQDFDATGTHANIQGLQAQTSIRLPFERPIPKGETGAQAKARAAAVKQDLVAARPVVEAGGSKARLAAELAKVNASTDGRLREKFAPIYQYARDNFDRLNRMLVPHVKLANENYDSLKAAGVDVGKRADYVHRVTTPPEDPNAPHLAFEMGNGNGSGNARGMLKGRSFDTMGDAIKAGYDPGDYGIHEADGRMVQNSTRIIGDKAFLDKMKQVKAPTDGKPIISQLVKRRLANGETDLKTPDGYAMVQAMGRPLVIHKMFAPLFRDLYGSSAIRNFAAGRALLKLAAAGKHGTLVFDTFHGGRILYKMAAGGGGAPIVIRDGRPVFNYHAGLSLLEYADKDLAVAVKQGEVMPEEAAYAKKHRAALDELVKAGLNVGKVADNLMDQVKRHIPVITTMNDWLFSKLSRGAMVQTALAFHERNLARPGITREQAARRTATEMNEYFGNLQNQGIFKSKTLQDIARLVFLAPNWTESQARYEARAYGQLGASAVDAARGKGLRAGNASRAMATGFVALLAANQVANYLSRGQSTFQNEEDGHKLDAWVPGGKRGFWFNPFEIAGEYAHAAMKYTAQHENPVDVATHIASNKLSPLARGVKEAGTGRDAMGRHFLNDTDRFRSAAVDALPSPLPLGSVFEKDPRAPIGYRMTRAPGAMEKQLLQSAGAKVTAAQSPRTQLFALAQPFRPEGQYSDNAGQFTNLKAALDNDQPGAALTEMKWLMVDQGKDLKSVASSLGIHSGGISPERYTGSKEGDQAMLKSFTPKQRALWQRGQDEHAENAKKFLAIVRSPDGQQIIADARKKAIQKK